MRPPERTTVMAGCDSGHEASIEARATVYVRERSAVSFNPSHLCAAVIRTRLRVVMVGRRATRVRWGLTW